MSLRGGAVVPIWTQQKNRREAIILRSNVLFWRLATFAVMTIIASTMLNFCVRNENRWYHSDKSPEQNIRLSHYVNKN